jgi:hypothetical protein
MRCAAIVSWAGGSKASTSVSMRRFDPSAPRRVDSQPTVRSGTSVRTNTEAVQDRSALRTAMCQMRRCAFHLDTISRGVTNVTGNLLAPATLFGDRLNQLDLRFGKVLRMVPSGPCSVSTCTMK